MPLLFLLTLLFPINAIPSDNFLFMPPESARTSVLILSDNPTWKGINNQDQTAEDQYLNGSIKQQKAFIYCPPKLCHELQLMQTEVLMLAP